MVDELLARLSTAIEGRYTVERQIGEGGMATVFLADDIRHGRKVALKVLKPELAAVIGADRFLTEIKTTAGLQHPHILPLFDSGEADSFLFYVMPYIEGESLRDRLDRETQLPVKEAIKIASAVASALDYAHRHDVIHRDIKPANILLHEGNPVVADFGIALAISAAGGGRMTETGLSLGTPHYMSPEQATAERDLTARSDVYSLACVLYEMLAGNPPHAGPTAQSVLMKILTQEPQPVTEVRRSVPRHVAAALTKALEKLPADRFEDAEAFQRALEDESFQYRSVRPTGEFAAQPRATATPRLSPTTTPLARALPWSIAVAGLVVAVWGWMDPAPTPASVSRFAVVIPDDQPLALSPGRTVGLTPDGSRLVYRGTGPSGPQLFLREIGTLEARPIAGTEGGDGPFFSPDGAWMGFFADAKLKKVALAGGPPVILTDAGAPRGGTWTDSDDIVFAGQSGEGLARIPAAGGAVERLTTPDATLGETSHRFPSAIPGGESLVFTVFAGNPTEGAVAVLSLESGQVTRLVEGAFGGKWIKGGYLAYASPDGTLLAAPFDASRRELTGGAVAMVEGVSVALGSSAVDFTISDDGSLVYLLTDGSGDALLRVDRDGSETLLADSVGGGSEGLRFSPDGESVVMGVAGEGQDIWIYDLDSRTQSRLTFAGTNRYPNWSPNGDRISFGSRRVGSTGFDVLAKSADGSGDPSVIYTADGDQYENVWTPDGRALVVRQTVPGTGRDIWIVPIEEDLPPQPFIRTQFNERAIAISPDGHWLAYVSDETGRAEVYVRAFPGPGGRSQISTTGGGEPAWTPSGDELIYRSNGNIIAARVATDESIRVLERVPLFRDIYQANVDHTEYDIHPTEGWFIMARQLGAAAPQLIWVQNWVSELRSRSSQERR